MILTIDDWVRHVLARRHAAAGMNWEEVIADARMLHLKYVDTDEHNGQRITPGTRGVRCHQHPKYRYVGSPRRSCHTCWSLYALESYLRMERKREAMKP